ncbi:MAG: MATE family efflux transporter [Coprobacillus sp.]|nr:MATE family efflux transporter [Coprobacillus sp.]
MGEEQVSSETNKMGRKSILSLLISLGIPTILSLVLQSIYNIIDTAFVINMPGVSETGQSLGQLGNLALSYAFPVQLLIIAFGVGTGIGINALLSKSISEKNESRISKIIGNGIFMALILWVFFIIVGLVGSKAIISWVCTDEEAYDMGVQYLRIICFLSIGTIGFTIFERFLQASGKSIYSMSAQITGACVNIFLDWLFIYPLGWGVVGAAWATVISQCLSFALVLIFQFTINKDAKIMQIKHILPDKSILGGIYKVGWSAIIMQGLLSVMMYGLLAILKCGPAEIVADLQGSFGIYYKIMTLALYIAFGFSNTIITLLSFNYGLKDKQRVKDCIKWGLIITIILMVIVIALFEGLAYQIAWIFGMAEGNEAMTEIVTNAIRIAASGYLFMGISVTIQGIFQGLHMSVRPLIISILRLAALIMPITYLFMLTSDPLSTWWWAFPITEFVTMIVSIFLLIDVYKKFINTMPDKQHRIKNTNLVITISRQHGSSGRLIGKALADRLGINYYDKELLSMVSEETNISTEYLEEKFGEISKFDLEIVTKEPNRDAIIKQREVVRRVASTSSCVIVGRAANYFLQDYEGVINVFVYADKEERIKNVMAEYGDNQEEALNHIKISDKSRRKYYKFISNLTWGEESNYDLLLDSSVGVDVAVETLYDYVMRLQEKEKTTLEVAKQS